MYDVTVGTHGAKSSQYTSFIGNKVLQPSKTWNSLFNPIQKFCQHHGLESAFHIHICQRWAVQTGKFFFRRNRRCSRHQSSGVLHTGLHFLNTCFHLLVDQRFHLIGSSLIWHSNSPSKVPPLTSICDFKCACCSTATWTFPYFASRTSTVALNLIQSVDMGCQGV